MSRPATLPWRAPRRYLLGGFVMEPTVAAAWASRLLHEPLDPLSNYDTICTAILKKVNQHHAKFDLVGETLAKEAKYIIITRSTKFPGYKDMDPYDIPRFREGDKEATIREFLKAEGVGDYEFKTILSD